MKFFAWLSWAAFCVLLSILVWESIEYCLNPPAHIAEPDFPKVLSSSWLNAVSNIFAYLLLDPFQYCEFTDNKLFSVLVIFSVLSLIISFLVWAVHGAIKDCKR